MSSLNIVAGQTKFFAGNNVSIPGLQIKRRFKSTRNVRVYPADVWRTHTIDYTSSFPFTSR